MAPVPEVADIIPPSNPGSEAGWVWALKVDPTSGEYGVFINYGNQINLPTSGTVISGMRVVLSNTFATLPVCGHGYATAQFMGRGSTEVSFQLSGVGHYQLSRLQAMVEECEKNARGFRRIKGAAQVDFSNNPLLALCGITDGIVSGVDAKTEEGFTDLYRMTLSFTSEGHHMESWGQENYTVSSCFMEMLDGLMRRITATPTSYRAAIARLNNPTQLQILTWPVFLPARGMTRRYGQLVTSPEGVLEVISAQGEININRARDLFVDEEDLPRSAGESSVPFGGSFGGRAVLAAPVFTLFDRNEIGTAYFEANLAGGPAWLRDSLRDLANILNELMPTLPPRPFFREGEDKGRYRRADPRAGHLQTATLRELPPLFTRTDSIVNELMWGLRNQWPNVRDIQSALNRAQGILMGFAQETFWNNVGQPDFEQMFPGMVAQVLGSRQRSLHPAYPDLDLPVHPKSGSVLETEPDFYFFNDSEEGMLNEVGPEIIQEMDYRLEQAELSMMRLASGDTWNSTYMGRSRIGPDDPNAYVGSMSEREPTFPMDGAPSSTLSVDRSTSSPDSPEENRNSSRRLGERTSRQDQAVVDSIFALSSTARSSIDNEELLSNRRRMLEQTSLALPSGSASSPLGIGPIDNTVTAGDRTQSFNRNFVRQVIHQGVLQEPEKTLTMRRAFPTFKIYFLEDDIGAEGREHLLGAASQTPLAGVRTVMAFDDFYNYNSVKEIRLVRSRKNPADLLVLTLTNVAGLLERRIWGPNQDFPTEAYAPGLEETELENPLKKLVLKEGLKVQARLAYTNNPDNMGVKFIGEVVEVSYNAECSDEVTIICQSFGAELVLEPKGLAPDQRMTFDDTPDILHTMICSPELAHFGRYSLNPLYNPAEARSEASSSGSSEGGLGIIWNPHDIATWARGELLHFNSKYMMTNNPADDNIYAPSVTELSSVWERFWSNVGSWLQTYSDLQRGVNDAIDSIPIIRYLHMINGGRWIMRWTSGLAGWLAQFTSPIDFTPAGQTIWEIFKECELRHPGWVAQPRPYGTRMTMFFGIPTWRYWADEIDTEEMIVLQRLRGAIDTFTTMPSYLSDPRLFGGGRAAWFLYRTGREIRMNRWLGEAGEYVGRTSGRIRPFRRYHIITSDHNIILNNIRASDKGTFNAVNVVYNGGSIYTLKADDSIPEERTTVETFDEYSNSIDSELMARRYAIGLLNRHLKDIYKGEVVVVGMDVDPWDSIYLHDDRTGMYGCFDVEQVVDTISPETGWITEITPDLITGTNEWSTMSTGQARMAVLGTLTHRYLGQTALGVGISGVIPGGPLLAWAGGYYIIRWSQDRQPIWVCPLILGERPFFAGLDGFRQDGIFASLRGRLVAEVDNVQQGWRAFHLAGYFSDIGTALGQGLAGQSGQ